MLLLVLMFDIYGFRQRDKEMALLDTVPEEMIAPYFKSGDVDAETLASSGISYKDRLKQVREKRNPVAAAAPVTPQPAVETAPEPVQPAPQQPVVEAAAPAQPVEVAAPQQPASVAPPSPEEMRTKIRTLMGLILKHRGGPGFGAGRLKGPEIDRFESSLEEISALLREEAMQTAPQEVPMMTVPQTPPAPAAPVTEAPAQSLQASPAAPDTPATMDQIDSAIACIEGAITMYKNSPPEIRESVVITLRAALLSAVNTCNDAIGPEAPVNPTNIQGSTGGQPAQVDSAVACIEGAVTMYKNSPPELRGSVLVALRAALMSAVNTCNSVVANNEVANLQSYQATAESQSPAAPAAPAVAVPVPQAMDRNSKALEEILENVASAAGDGSLGLRSDLTTAEASILAENLSEVRGILMEELDAGIPDPSEPERKPKSTSKESAPEPSGASRYQEMLAKARAAKELK